MLRLVSCCAAVLALSSCSAAWQAANRGQEALDRLGDKDKNPNGLFTRIFLREMLKPGVPLDRVVRSVRTQVVELAKSIGHEQVPATYDQTLGDFFFVR